MPHRARVCRQLILPPAGSHRPFATVCWFESGGPAPIGRQRPPIQGPSIASIPSTVPPAVPDPTRPSEPPFPRTKSGLRASAAGELTAISLPRVLVRLHPMPNKDRATNPPPQNQGCRCHADTAYQVQTRTFGLRIGLSGLRNPDGRRRQRPTRGGMTVQFSHVDWVVALLFAKTNGPSSCR